MTLVKKLEGGLSIANALSQDVPISVTARKHLEDAYAALAHITRIEARLREAEEVIARQEKAGSATLEAMDAYNVKHSAYLGGPAFFELGRSVAVARAFLKGACCEGEGE